MVRCEDPERTTYLLSNRAPLTSCGLLYLLCVAQVECGVDLGIGLLHPHPWCRLTRMLPVSQV